MQLFLGHYLWFTSLPAASPKLCEQQKVAKPQNLSGAAAFSACCPRAYNRRQSQDSAADYCAVGPQMSAIPPQSTGMWVVVEQAVHRQPGDEPSKTESEATLLNEVYSVL